MNDTREIAALRTLLKDVNIAHSALLRSNGTEQDLGGLAELKRQRVVLMGHLAELRRLQPVEASAAAARDPMLEAVPVGIRSGVGAAVMAAAVLVQRYWGGWAARGQTVSGKAV
jgi:hypothetical protein